jgi:hypothetical protein
MCPVDVVEGRATDVAYCVDTLVSTRGIGQNISPKFNVPDAPVLEKVSCVAVPKCGVENLQKDLDSHGAGARIGV